MRSRHAARHGPFLGHTVLALLFVGFATKAGVLPMGDWLPDAHPVAPSGMSAALSGALVKLGIYGLVRCLLRHAAGVGGAARGGSCWQSPEPGRCSWAR